MKLFENIAFKVDDQSLAPWGRKEIEIAEKEMPGLMALRKKYGAGKVLKGARITGSLHMILLLLIQSRFHFQRTFEKRTLER